MIQFNFRMPKELHQFLIDEAKRNERSRNGQMVLWLKEKMNEQQKAEAVTTEVSIKSSKQHNRIGNLT